MDLLNWSLLLGSFALLIKILHEIAKYTITSSLLIKELGVNLQKIKIVDVSHITWLQDVLYLVNDRWRAWPLSQTLINQGCQNKHDTTILCKASQ